MRRLTTFLLVIPLLGAVASPVMAQSLTTTEEMLSGMVTEEVEPGVFRVVNDGVRDLSSENNWDVIVGRDGGVWLLRGGFAFLRLGTEAVHEGQWPDDMYPYWGPSTFGMAADGALWTLIRARDDGSSASLALRSQPTGRSFLRRPGRSVAVASGTAASSGSGTPAASVATGPRSPAV